MIVNTSVVASSAGLVVYTGDDLSAVESTESVSDVSHEVKPFDEAKFWAEIALIGKMAELARDREEIAAELAEKKTDWEKLKNDTSQARELVSDLEADLKDKTDEFMELAIELCSVARGNALKDLPAKAVTEETMDDSSDTANQDDGWRLHPTVELLKDIKGNKSKKDLVIDAAPTIGHLEDIRGEASKECVSFNTKLPKGCGKGFAQSIEDLLVEFIGKWVAQRSNPEATIQVDELLAEIRAASEQNGWTKEDCQPKDTDSPSLKAGFLAFNEGRPHTDVVVDDLNAAKQWMIGWVGGEFLSK